MPSKRKQKSKARKSKEGDMLYYIENLYIMLGSNRLEREECEFSNFVSRPESPSYNAFVNHYVNSHSGEDEIRRYAENGQNSRNADPKREI